MRHGRSVGNQDVSALQQGMYLFTRLALEGFGPTARAIKHTHCNRTEAGCGLPEGIVYCV